MKKLFENQVAVDKDKVTLNPVRYEAKEEAPSLDTSTFDSEQQSLEANISDLDIGDAELDDISQPSMTKEELAELFSEELAALREETKQQAYEEGMQTAEAHAKEQLAELESSLKVDYEKAIENLTNLTSNLKGAIDESIQENESDLVEVVFSAVLKILGEKAVDRTLVKLIVSENIKKCYESNITKIKLSQDDFKLFKSANEALQLDLPAEIAIEPDVSLLPGGCKIETDKGTLDARLDSQIERFKAFLLENYRGSVD